MSDTFWKLFEIAFKAGFVLFILWTIIVIGLFVAVLIVGEPEGEVRLGPLQRVESPQELTPNELYLKQLTSA
jgi:hypothetical protein